VFLPCEWHFGDAAARLEPREMAHFQRAEFETLRVERHMTPPEALSADGDGQIGQMCKSDR